MQQKSSDLVHRDSQLSPFQEDEYDDYEINSHQRVQKSSNFQSPTCVLLVCVYNKNGTLITHDVYYRLFSEYGAVKKILIFQKAKVWKTFIEFESIEQALLAKDKLNEYQLFDDGSRMNIYLSNLETITLQNDNTGGIDYGMVKKQTSTPQQPVQQGFKFQNNYEEQRLHYDLANSLKNLDLILNEPLSSEKQSIFNKQQQKQEENEHDETQHNIEQSLQKLLSLSDDNDITNSTSKNITETLSYQNPTNIKQPVCPQKNSDDVIDTQNQSNNNMESTAYDDEQIQKIADFFDNHISSLHESSSSDNIKNLNSENQNIKTKKYSNSCRKQEREIQKRTDSKLKTWIKDYTEKTEEDLTQKNGDSTYNIPNKQPVFPSTFSNGLNDYSEFLEDTKLEVNKNLFNDLLNANELIKPYPSMFQTPNQQQQQLQQQNQQSIIPLNYYNIDNNNNNNNNSSNNNNNFGLFFNNGINPYQNIQNYPQSQNQNIQDGAAIMNDLGSTYVNPKFLKENKKAKVIYCRGLDNKNIKMDHLINLFSNFGNIKQICFIRQKGAALIEFENIEFATQSKDFMNNMPFMGNNLKIFYSNYSNIAKRQQQFEDDELIVVPPSNYRFASQVAEKGDISTSDENCSLSGNQPNISNMKRYSSCNENKSNFSNFNSDIIQFQEDENKLIKQNSLNSKKFENLQVHFNLQQQQQQQQQQIQQYKINPPSQTLHVSNLKKESCREDVIQKLFSKYGKVLKCKLLQKDNYKFMSLVKLESLSDAFQAMAQLQGQLLNGRKLHLSFTRSKI